MKIKDIDYFQKQKIAIIQKKIGDIKKDMVFYEIDAVSDGEKVCIYLQNAFDLLEDLKSKIRKSEGIKMVYETDTSHNCPVCGTHADAIRWVSGMGSERLCPKCGWRGFTWQNI